MNPGGEHPVSARHAEVDPWELQLFLVELRDWVIVGEHHMHKSWQFLACQQALRWHSMAQVLCHCHGCDCLFYLGHVGSGRIETDILNRIKGHLTRNDLDVAVMLNVLEAEVKRQV